MKELIKKWWFWVITLIMLTIICVTIFMLYALKLAAGGVNAVAIEVQKIDEEATLFVSAGHNVVIVEIPNYTDDTKKEKVENIKELIALQAQRGETLGNFSKFIICKEMSDGNGYKEYMISTNVYNLPEMTQDIDEGSLYIDFVEYTRKSLITTSN